ncbi:MAG: hypothetical protein A2V63_05275 [Candidatus Eisenbacteria bacterium RBG_19FT_COMBO_70_11]|nr:MAG: hypothetical protein A2V63_05275 [Candidatus Eisenbacteria bacterium RBG_19FT_COMBO_70_11]
MYLVAPFSGGPADSLRHKALLWYALLGTAEPHELWVASLDGGPAGAQLYDAGIGGDTLAVVRARGDVVLRAAHAVWDFSPVVEPRNSPSSYVRVEEIYRFVGDYPHLVQARPVDDATLALVRAAEAQHGLGLWPVADLEVDPALGAWLAANPHVTAASTSREAPEVWRIELLGSRERAAAVVTRVAAGPGIRWQLRLAGPAVPHAR